MECRWLSGFLASIVLVQGASVAHADEVVVDLPNPFDIGGEQQSLPQPLPPSTVQSEYIGTVQVNSVSRKIGGTLLCVSLSPALVLQRLEVKVLKSQVKIYESTLITSTGPRIAVREFKETGVLRDASTLSTGCGRGFCVNDDVMVVSRNNRRARVAGIQMNGLYVLRFLDNGLVGGNWANSDLGRSC